ncbi:MAG: energy-coupling factor transporter transmembrane protein EcfT [Firmicutes bacterium]|nr:energy-coupling factor transporter transmembrane protein EcfT [Bacillota bacterium]
MRASGLMLGRYLPGASPVHTLDPRVKLGLASALGILIFICTDPVSYTVILAGLSLAARAAGLGLVLLARGLRPAVPFLLFTLTAHLLFTRGGEPLLAAGPLIMYEKGAALGVLMTLRLLLLLLTAALLSSTTPPLALSDAGGSLLHPLRRLGIPAGDLAVSASLAFRFIPTLWEEAQRLARAQAVRGARLSDANPARRIRSYLALLVPLFTSVLERADHLREAMEARCFKSGGHRVPWRGRLLTVKDAAAVLITGAFAALVWLIRGWSGGVGVGS